MDRNNDTNELTQKANEDQPSDDLNRGNEIIRADKNRGAMVGDAVFENGLATETHSAIVDAVTDIVSESRGRQIANRLRDIQELVEHETISGLRRDKKLTPEDEALSDTVMVKYGLSTQLMTPDEIKDFNEWASNRKPGARDEKAEIISDMIFDTLNGKRRRRDNGMFQDLVGLNTKFDRWERGGIDTSIPFDFSTLNLRAKSSGNGHRKLDYDDFDFDDEAQRRQRDSFPLFDEDDYSFDLTDVIIDYMDGFISSDELCDELRIDPETLDEIAFVYGPYTKSDLETLGDLSYRSYTDLPDQRLVSPVGELVDSALPVRSDDIENGLNYYYIGERVLPNRRLNARDLITSASALGLASQDTINDDAKSLAHSSLRKNLGWCSYYIARICRIGSMFDQPVGRQLRITYGRARPLSSDFYSEAIARAENWTDNQAMQIDESYNQYLVKLEEWLYRAEYAFGQITNSSTTDDRDESGDAIPDVFGSIDSVDMPELPSPHQR